MNSIVQKIEESNPRVRKLAMPHFADKSLTTYANARFDGRTVKITYYAPDLAEAVAQVAAFANLSGKYLEIDEERVVDVITNLDVTLQPDMPITWSKSVIYPRLIQEYINQESDEYGAVISPFNYAARTISSYNISLSMEPIRFFVDGVFKGLKYDFITFNISISTFYRIEELDTYVPPIFNLPINYNTLEYEEAVERSNDGQPTWTYTFTGSLL